MALWHKNLTFAGLLALLVSFLPVASNGVMADVNGWETPSNVSNSGTLTRYGAVSSSSAWPYPVVTYLENENPNDYNDLTLRAKVWQGLNSWSPGQLIMEAQFLSDQEVMQLLQSSGGDLSAQDVYAGVSYWQPRQASDTNGKIHVVVSPRSGGNCNASAVMYVRLMNSGGLPHKDLGPKQLSSNTCLHAGFAQIAVNPDNNNIYVVYLQYNGPNGYVVRSTDGGNNWSSPITVATNVQGYAGITVQAVGGKVVVAWGDGNRRVKAKVVDESSFDQNSFNSATIEDLSGGVTGCTGISSALSPSGKIYVACAMRQSSVAASYVSVSVYDPSSGWIAENVHAAQGNRTVHRGVIAVDHSEKIWLAWDNDTDNRELRVSWGHIQGGNWQEDQPAVTVSGRGEFPVAAFGPRLGEFGVHLVSMKDSDVWYTFRQTSCLTAAGSFTFEEERAIGADNYTKHGPNNALAVSWCGGPPNPTTKMRFQVDNGLWSAQVNVTNPYTVTLGSDGPHTVVAEFATVTTPTTLLVTRTAYLDTQPPVMDGLTITKGTGSSANVRDVLAQDGTYVSTRYSKVRVTLTYHDVVKDGYQSGFYRVWATHGSSDPVSGGPWRRWGQSQPPTSTQTIENNWDLFAYGGSGSNVLRTISARVEDRAGNVSSNVVTASIFIDRKPPTGTLTLCSQDGSSCGITSTNTPTITLKIDAFDNAAGYANSLGKPKVAKFRLRNGGDQWTDWMWYDDSYATTGYQWRVGPFKASSRTVQVQLMDYAGYTSPIYSKRIFLDPSLVDTVRPSGGLTIWDAPNTSQLSPMTETNTATVTLHLSPSDNYPESGLPTVRYFRLRNAGGRWTGWLPYNNSYTSGNVSWRLQPGLPGVRTVYVQYMDWAGNLSPIAANTARFSDPVIPQVTVLLNGGASSTSDRKVDVTFVITDTNPVIRARIANGNPFGPTSSWSSRTLNPDDPKVLNWSLASGAGQKYVWVQLQDWGFNWSVPVSATITYSP